MGIINTKVLKGHKKPKGPKGRRPPSNKQTRSKEETKDTGITGLAPIDVTKEDLDVATTRAEQKTNNDVTKSRAQRPKNRRPPTRAGAKSYNPQTASEQSNQEPATPTPPPRPSLETQKESSDHENDENSTVDRVSVSVHHKIGFLSELNKKIRKVSNPDNEQNITDAGEKSKDEAAVGTERSEVDAVHPRLKQDKSIEDEGVEKRKKDSIIG